jgi:hypothetical protein
MADHPHHTSHDAADHDAEAYVHGSMTIEEQRQTWDLFMGLTKWGSLAVAAILLLLTLWFMPGGSLITGVLGGGALAVAGFFFLKSPKQSH